MALVTIQIELSEKSGVQTPTDVGRVLAMVTADILNRGGQSMEVCVGESNRISDIDGEHVGFWGVSAYDH